MKKTLLASMFGMLVSVSGCQAQDATSDSFRTENGTEINIFCIKHGSVRMQIGGKWLYVDPVGKGAQPVTDYSVLPKADVILITHEHGDHLDPDAIALLTKEGTQIIANASSRQKLGRGEAMNVGDWLEIGGGVTVKAVAAYNSTEGRQNFHPKGRDNGYLITVDGFVIYVAGDTEDIPEMKELPSGIDVAFLPCNQPYTMTPEQLAAAAGVFRPKVLFPYHYGNTDMQQVLKLLEGSGVDVRIRQSRLTRE
ncbi:MAG: MBL fold metallo-hydrolase [Bacteroidaceae bacterium]|nr:MBL fold metallo-hydrolase [Bacteroidaceae bacterium]